MLFFSRCGNDKFSDGGHDLHMTQRSESILFKAFVLWRVEVNCRWSCGKGLLFASVNSIWFVFSNGFSDCFVLFVFRLVLVRYIDGRKVQEKPRRVQFCKLFFSNGSLLLLSSFSLVCLKFRIRCSFFRVCVISWPHERVDPEECVMVFQRIFAPWHQLPQVCIHFECCRGSLQGWTDVESMVMLKFSVSGS